MGKAGIVVMTAITSGSCFYNDAWWYGLGFIAVGAGLYYLYEKREEF